MQAVIKSAVTRAVLATVSLTDRGNGYFDYEWRTIVDKDGQGTQITIVTSVYADSGYTTRSDSYGDKGEAYTILDIQRLAGGGGGGDVDYKKIEKIVSKVIGDVESTETPEVDLSPVLEGLKKLQKLVGAIEIPEIEIIPEHVCDDAPILEAISKLSDAVQNIPTDTPDAVDLSPVLDKLDEQGRNMETKQDESKEKADTSVADLKDFIPKALKDVLESTTYSTEVVMKPSVMNEKPATEDTQEEPEEVDPVEIGSKFLS